MAINKKELPKDIHEYFLQVLKREEDFVGEKKIDDGFLVKRTKNKATLGVDTGMAIYTVKMAYINKKWLLVGSPSVWENIGDLLEL